MIIASLCCNGMDIPTRGSNAIEFVLPDLVTSFALRLRRFLPPHSRLPRRLLGLAKACNPTPHDTCVILASDNGSLHAWLD